MNMGRLSQQARLRSTSAFLIIGLIAFIGGGNATADFTGGGTAAAEQIGPSFDCHAAQQPLAQMLCSDPDLSRTDLRFAQAYFALLRQVGEAGKRELKREDLQFLEAVQRKCGIPTSGPSAPQSEASQNCVKSAYEAQRAVWVLRLTSPFSEEANRPIERHVSLQRLLQQLGFLPAEALINGVYGAGTRDAISKWQTAQAHSVTGVLADAEAQALEQQTSKGGPVTAAIEPRGSEPLRPSVENQPKNGTTSTNATDPVRLAVKPVTSQTDTSDCKIHTDPPITQTAPGLLTPYKNVTTSWGRHLPGRCCRRDRYTDVV